MIAAESQLKKFRNAETQNTIVQYYLQIFLDAHTPLFTSAIWSPDVTVQHIIENNLLPEEQHIPCHTLFPNHLAHIHYSTSTTSSIPKTSRPPKSRITNCLLRAVQNSTTARSLAKHRDVIDFSRQCIKASILGNYLHARLPKNNLIDISSRIAAVTDEIVTSKFDELIIPSLLEYAAAVAPFLSIVPNWFTRSIEATILADRNIRKFPISPAQQQQLLQLQSTDTDTDIDIDIQERKRCDDDEEEDGEEKPASYGYLSAPTGYRYITVCTQCTTISANIVNPQRGFHPTTIIVNPFGKSQDQDPDTYCETCDTRHTRLELHGIYLCLRPGCTIVVCPGCNHVHSFPGKFILLFFFKKRTNF